MLSTGVNKKPEDNKKVRPLTREKLLQKTPLQPLGLTGRRRHLTLIRRQMHPRSRVRPDLRVIVLDGSPWWNCVDSADVAGKPNLDQPRRLARRENLLASVASKPWNSAVAEIASALAISVQDLDAELHPKCEETAGRKGRKP